MAAMTMAAMTMATQAVAQQVDVATRAADAGDPPGGWTLDLGAAALTLPRFPGAERQRTLAIPSVEIHYGDLFFFTFADGLGLDLLGRGDWHAGPVANFAFPRREKDDRAALNGLGDVPFTVEGGAYLRYDFDRYATTKLEVRKGIGGREGIVAELSLDAHAPPLLHDALFLSLGPRVSGYDRHYARAYYGVDADQARRSGYAAFAPGSGLKVGVGVSAVFLLSDRWTLTAFGDYGRLAGGVGRSPLVLGSRGSRNQVTAGLSLTRRLAP